MMKASFASEGVKPESVGEGRRWRPWYALPAPGSSQGEICVITGNLSILAAFPASLSATEAKANNRPCSRLGWPVLRHAERGRNGGSYSIASNIYKANLMLNCGWRDAAHNL